VAVTAVVVLFGSVLVGGQAGANGDLPTQEPIEVVAEGLFNPRHLEVNRVGRLYVAEAGRGGSTPVDTPLGPDPAPVCVGTTGAISVIVRGEVRRVVEGLPSVAASVDGSCEGPGVGFAATGPQGIDVTTMDPTYSVGLGGTTGPRAVLTSAEPTAEVMGTVNTLRRPRFDNPADIAAFETANDPNGEGADSNPTGVLRLPGGTTAVVDSGANAVFAVSPEGDVESVLAVFAPRCVPWQLPFPNPVPPQFNPCGTQDEFPAEAVPTGVARAANGDLLVSTLGGFPFPAGFAQIYRVEAGYEGTAVCSSFAPVPAAGCAVFADGLTGLVDLEVAPDGKVYAVQFADAGVLAGQSGGPGADAGSVQILHRRTGEKVGQIVGLSLPGGVAIDGRDVYITNASIVPGGGQVVRARTLCTALAKAACQAG
jgi:hypothetical protein